MGVLLAVLLPVAGCKGGDSSSKSSGTSSGDAKGGTAGGSSSTSGGQAAKTGGSDKDSGGADTSGKAEGGGDVSMPADSVKIEPANQSRAGIRVGPVEVRRVARSLTVAGQVTVDERHTDHIGVLAEGQIERVMVLPGDAVRAGQTLALMHSHSVHETAGALMQAFAAVTRQTSGVRFAEENRDRYQHLLALKVASEEEAQRANQQLRQAQLDLADAEANVHMEREHLSELLQVEPQTLNAGNLYQHELIPVRAVAAGTVMTRGITPGQVMNLGDEAFTISNLATVWVAAAVNEKDLPGVRRDAHANVTTQGYPGVNFPGTVRMLGDQLDPQTRTLPVRVVVANPGTKLRPGMFATADIDEAATRTAIFVPEAAVQDVNGLPVVFVTGDGATFQVRAVKLGTHSHGLVEAVEGLNPGDHVVVDGAFMVKGELLKGSVGEG